MNELPAVDFKARPARPVLGPSLWVFGALLWSYVVTGELVVRAGFPEPLGWVGVLSVLGASWYFATERSFTENPPTPDERLPRTFSPLAAALGLWLTTLALSAAIGRAIGAESDAFITVFLWLFSLPPFFFGRRMTGTRRRAIDPSRRPLGVLLWIGSAVVTTLALFPIIQ